MFQQISRLAQKLNEIKALKASNLGLYLHFKKILILLEVGSRMQHPAKLKFVSEIKNA